MGQDYVKRMEADSNTFRKQRGSYNEVVVKGAACPGTFQGAAVIVGYALDICSPKRVLLSSRVMCIGEPIVLSFHFLKKFICIFLFNFWMDEAVYRYQYYIIDIGWYNVISWMLLH
ncbi:hypothetical protein NC653_014568 [Populus alba x Populus x berolinensis]|uniref:Uncharacterized protein n=1 Tax=Populus alba x Populus x berolinensis TaxID=444605 RepID=A0AAD6QXD7_9ROSI|nr:hypothetical protein NC653_014568 [Populus alba x Populus x berolinensis]